MLRKALSRGSRLPSKPIGSRHLPQWLGSKAIYVSSSLSREVNKKLNLAAEEGICR